MRPQMDGPVQRSTDSRPVGKGSVRLFRWPSSKATKPKVHRVGLCEHPPQVSSTSTPSSNTRRFAIGRGGHV